MVHHLITLGLLKDASALPVIENCSSSCRSGHLDGEVIAEYVLITSSKLEHGLERSIL